MTAAPGLILVSFCQTIAVFLETEIPWPASIRQLMIWFSVLNFNIEFARPECSRPFGALEKMQVAVLAPAFVFGVLLVYVLLRLCWIRARSRTAAQKLAGKRDVVQKVTSTAITLFTVGSIFFVRSFLRAFNCALEVDDGGDGDGGSPRFMVSSPEIECSEDDAEYVQIRHLATVGLIVFGVVYLCMMCALLLLHNFYNKNLGYLGFIADKYEDGWYFWELVIVLRKVLLMAAFLLFKQVFAVLLGTALVVLSLSIHIAARPYEDAGTDWTECLTLVAQLFLLVAGPVFKILNDPENTMHGATATRFRHGLVEHDRLQATF